MAPATRLSVLLSLAVGAVGVVAAVLAGAALPAAAQEAVSPGQRTVEGGETQGWGDSYWGPIAARADSAEGTVGVDSLAKTPRPAWEYPLLVPYYVIKVPLWLIYNGLGAGYRYMDESGTLHRLSEIFAPKLVPYGVTATMDLASLAGLGFGASFFHDEVGGGPNRVQFKAKISSSGSHRIAVGSFWNYGRRTSLEAGAGYRSDRVARYFGLGPRSSQEDESFFTQETSWGGLILHQQLFWKMHIEAMGLFSGVGARRPGRREPALPDAYPPDEIPKGYGGLSTGTTGSLTLIRDSTNREGRLGLGSIQRLRAGYFHDSEDADARYWFYRVGFEAFVPAWFTDRLFAFRGYVHWLDAKNTDVPFQRLLTNDDPDEFRGYKDNRFRDRGITALSIEYRWAVWANRQVHESGLDGYIATDFAQVFNEYAEINSRNVTINYVVGLRGVRSSGFAWRAEIGWSKDEIRLQFTSDQIFQFLGENLFRGREEVALR